MFSRQAPKINLVNAYKILANSKILKEHVNRIYQEAIENFEKSYQGILSFLPPELRASLHGRVKSKLSIYEKLVKEKDANGKNVTDEEVARAIIRDDIGARLILKDTKPESIQKFVDALVAAIRRGDIEVLEVENYRGPGNDFYFTPEQIKAIREASKGKEISITEREKPGGYTATHVQIKPKGAKPIELQIRGKHVSEVADWEHITYDLRHKKDIARNDNRLGILLAPITKIINGLSAEQYARYQQYIVDYYAYAQKIDQGLQAEPPKFPEGLDEVLKPESLNNLAEEISKCTPRNIKNPINLKSKLSVTGGIEQTISSQNNTTGT